LIKAALEKTANAFCEQPPPIENWLSPYYQYANRLAALHFLMQESDHAIPSHLLFIYFYGDHRPDTECPQNKEDWYQSIEDMEKWLAINHKSLLIKYVHHLYLPVNPNQ
jgi:hypothetical protein